MTAAVLQRATTALLGIVAGHFYSLEVGTARVLDGLDDRAYLRFKTAMDTRYQRCIGPLWTLSLLTGAAAVIRDRNERGTVPIQPAAALALNAVAFGVLLAVNEPANAEHARIAAQRPTDSQPALRRRWNAGQTARTWLVGTAFLLSLTSVRPVTPSTRPRRRIHRAASEGLSRRA
jgi:hypothetical protein